jgi:hypothetical protein
VAAVTIDLSPWQLEGRLRSLRIRREKWSARVIELEGVHGVGVERKNAKASLATANRLIAVTEEALAKLAGETKSTTERSMDLEELRKLAGEMDAHARALGAGVKQMHSEIVARRLANNGRGPTGEMLSLNLRQAAEGHFSGSVLNGWPRVTTRRKTFSQLIDGWAPSLGAPNPPSAPPPPPPPAAKDRGFARKDGKPSLEGAPRLP